MSDTNNVRPVESSGRTNKRDLVSCTGHARLHAAGRSNPDRSRSPQISQLAEQLARAKEKSSLLQDAIDDAETKVRTPPRGPRSSIVTCADSGPE